MAQILDNKFLIIINICLNIRSKAKYWKAVIGTPEPKLITEVAENGTKNIADFIKRSELLKKQKIPKGIMNSDERVNPILRYPYLFQA